MGFHVSLPQEALARLLAAAGRAIAPRASQSVLRSVLLEAGAASLTATGYDLALGVRSSAIATVTEQGAMAVPHRLFAALVTALPAGCSVTLRAGEETLEIEAGEGRYSVQISDDAEDYPALPAPGDFELFSIPFGVLQNALRSVAYAASIEESRPTCQGVHFLAGTGELSLAAADGHRAAMFALPGAIEDDRKWSAIVPSAAVKEVLRMGLADDDLVIVNEGKGVALFDGGDTSIVTNLIAGKFPPFRNVVPKTGKVAITMDRQSLIEAVERAKVFADNEAGVVKIDYDSGTGEIAIKAENITGSAADILMSQDGTRGDSISISMYCKYLLDALRHLNGKTAEISTNSAVEQLVFRPAETTLQTSMVMPLGPRPAAT